MYQPPADKTRRKIKMDAQQELTNIIASAGKIELLLIIAAIQVKLAELGNLGDTDLQPPQDMTKGDGKRLIKRIRGKQSSFDVEKREYAEKIIHHLRTNWLHNLDAGSNPGALFYPRCGFCCGFKVFRWSCWADSNRRPHPYQVIKCPPAVAA